MLIPNTSTYIYLLFFTLHYIAQSTFFFFSCVYVNGDHAHANEQERRNQILFEHAITITARTRICPRARAFVWLQRCVQARIHTRTHRETQESERERDDEIQRSKFFPFTHHHTQERETTFVHWLIQRCTDWVDNIVIYAIYLVHLGLWFMIFPKLFVAVVSITKVKNFF
jgi:hypothetical protein